MSELYGYCDESENTGLNILMYGNPFLVSGFIIRI